MIDVTVIGDRDQGPPAGLVKGPGLGSVKSTLPINANVAFATPSATADTSVPSVEQSNASVGRQARFALDAGRSALAERRPEALDWLARAARLAPGDPTVGLLHAASLLDRDPARGRAMLDRLLTHDPDFRAARIMRIACDLRLGTEGVRHATAALADVLRRGAPPRDTRFRQLANAVVAAAGNGAGCAGSVPGWIGFGSDGTLEVSLHPAWRDPGTLEVMLDGVPADLVKLGRHRTGRGQNDTRLYQTCFTVPSWRDKTLLTARLGGIELLGSPFNLAVWRHVEGFVGPAEDDTDPGGLAGWARTGADPEQPVTLDLVLCGATGSKRSLGRLVTTPGPAGQFQISAGMVPSRGWVRVLDPDGRDLTGSPVLLGWVREHATLPERTLPKRTLVGAHLTTARDHELVASPDACDTDPWRPMPVLPFVARKLPSRLPRRRPVDIVIPVFRGAADLRACLATLRANPMRGARIVVIDDASPDPTLRAALDDLSARGRIILLRHSVNRGFPAAANTGLDHARETTPDGVGRDVLLLNPDTLLPPGAVRRLAEAAYSAPDIGTVTPMSNDGTIVSYPRSVTARAGPHGTGRKPPGIDAARADMLRLDAAFAAEYARGRHDGGGEALVELPTGVGFCLYIRADCLAETGFLRGDVFAQGYGEENDFCLRARALGWRHVAATGVFVAHAGGASFGAAKARLLARNIALLGRLHPGYDALVAAFLAADPLAATRRAVDLRLWRERPSPSGAVVLISHAGGGGVARHVATRAAALRDAGLRPILLVPAPAVAAMAAAAPERMGVPANRAAEQVSTSSHAQLGSAQPGRCRLVDPFDPAGPAPEFHHGPDLLEALAAALADQGVRWVELHHLLGHAGALAGLAARLDVPQDVFVHDYAAWCPRVTLVGRAQKYCGEPARAAECAACVRDLGGRLGEAIGPEALRRRSAAWMGSARRVIVACEDAARRIARQFPTIVPLVVPWEDDAQARAVPFERPPVDMRPAKTRTRIVVAGGIGLEKGFDILLGCARDAARRDLGLEFVLVGHSIDDSQLLETGRCFVTGPYDGDDDGVDLVRAQAGDYGLVPSVWPETWCYALSLLWRAGLAVACLDLGAQAERVRRAGAGAGTVLPLGLPAARLNDLLCRMTL